MTTVNLTHRDSKGMKLTGNILSGDTFPVKSYIKAYLGGKWNAEMKVWTVDAEKVMEITSTTGSALKIAAAAEPVATTRKVTSLCPKCGTYCDGDCEAN